MNKLTWAVTPSIRVEGFVEWDKYHVAGRGASATRPTTEVTALEPSPEWNWNGQLTWTINSRTMLNVRNGGYTGYFPVDPTPPQTRSGPFPHYDALANLYTANVPYYGRYRPQPECDGGDGDALRGQFPRKAHELKFGLEFEHSKIRNESGYPGGRYYYDYGGPYLVFLWQGYVTNAVGKRTSVYAQDTWTVSDRLTVNPGLRLDVNRGTVPSGTCSRTTRSRRVSAPRTTSLAIIAPSPEHTTAGTTTRCSAASTNSWTCPIRTRTSRPW